MTFFVSTFSIAFGPYALSVWEQPGARQNFGKLSKYFFMTICFITILLSAFSDVIVSLIASNKYHQAILIVPFILFAQGWTGLAEFTTLGITRSRKTHYFLILTIVNFLVLFLLLYFLVEPMNLIGAAISVFAASIVKTLICHVISKRYYEIKIDWADLLKMSLLVGLTIVLVYLDYNFNSIFSKVPKLMSVVFYPAICFWFILKDAERQPIIRKLNAMFAGVKGQ